MSYPGGFVPPIRGMERSEPYDSSLTHPMEQTLSPRHRSVIAQKGSRCKALTGLEAVGSLSPLAGVVMPLFRGIRTAYRKGSDTCLRVVCR